MPRKTTTNTIPTNLDHINLWDERRTGQADAAGVDYYVLMQSINSNRLKDVPHILSNVIKRASWKRWRWIGNEFTASTIEEYVSRHPPKGLGASVDLVRRLLVEHPDALEEFEQALRGDKAQALDAQAPDLKGRGQHGKPRGAKNCTMFRDDASYALARLRRDRPDLHARVLAGEISANAAMVLAGFRKPKPSRKLGPLDRIRAILPKLSAEEIRILREELNRCAT